MFKNSYLVTTIFEHKAIKNQPLNVDLGIFVPKERYFYGLL